MDDDDADYMQGSEDEVCLYARRVDGRLCTQRTTIYVGLRLRLLGQR